MTIDVAIEDVRDLIFCAQGDWEAPAYVHNALDGLEYILAFLKVVRAVPTTHDAGAEMAEWDQLFEDLKARANGR